MEPNQLCLRLCKAHGCHRAGGQERPTRGEELTAVTVLSCKKITRSMCTYRGNSELEEPGWEQKFMFAVCLFV